MRNREALRLFTANAVKREYALTLAEFAVLCVLAAAAEIRLHPRYLAFFMNDQSCSRAFQYFRTLHYLFGGKLVRHEERVTVCGRSLKGIFAVDVCRSGNELLKASVTVLLLILKELGSKYRCELVSQFFLEDIDRIVYDFCRLIMVKVRQHHAELGALIFNERYDLVS